MTVGRDISNILRRIVAGDVNSLSLLLEVPHPEIVEASEAMESLCLQGHVLRDVLYEWDQGGYADSDIQLWASFMRRGYLESRKSTRVVLIDISYEAAREDAIVEIISRLDEIGDVIDGHVSHDERLRMIESL